MSESNSYSDLWKYDDNDDDDDNIIETTATSKKPGDSNCNSKRKEMDDSEVLEILPRKKRKGSYFPCEVNRQLEENSQDGEEDEAEQVGRTQKRQSIVINLIDDDEEEEELEQRETPVENGCGRTVNGASVKEGQMSKIMSEINALKSDFLQIQEQETNVEEVNEVNFVDTQEEQEEDLENGASVKEGQMSKIMSEINALKSDFLQIQEQETNVEEVNEVNFVDTQEEQEEDLENGAKNLTVQQQSEEDSKVGEISKSVKIECPQGKISVKLFSSQKLEEIFSQFEEQAVENGWTSKGSQFQYTYFGSNIDGWQTLSDIGFRNSGSITASFKEPEQPLMKLKVQCQYGMLIEFKMGPSQNFTKLFEKCREEALIKNWINENTKLVFQFDGDTLETNSTPQDFVLEDEDQLEVIFKS
eukprot:TRINITY_DN5607_c0_g1_i1.p1 TRINITY_DN5607_c0_g1~~TRINITY_DN5607_c0_g1_i1.p1  ORF type:complete len:416 (-),score=89.86 TRINITY_DN5607_c0_g1_i1:388-1635(-)